MVPLIRTAVVVEWDDAIARCCEKNIDAPVSRMDLPQVDVVCWALRAHLPLHSVQISSPCTDFFTAVEWESAYVAVPATMVAKRVGAPTIFFENVPRMLHLKAWALAAALLAAAG